MDSRAAILRDPVGEADLAEAKPASFEQIQVDEPTGDEVLVEITAASLCHTDVSSARGHIEEPFPVVMGHEGAGQVAAVGEDVEGLDVGDQVVLGRIVCGRCDHCRAGKGQLCEKRRQAQLNGTLRSGAIRFSDENGPIHHYHGVSSFTEYTVVSSEVAVPIEPDLQPKHATLLGCGIFTGVGAVMNTADVEAGSSVVVFGVGGVGLSAVQAAQLRSATDIVAVDLLPGKLDLAAEIGATATVDAGREDVVDRIDEITGGVDYAFEVSGSPTALEQAVDSLAPTGTAVLVGVPPAGKHEVGLNLHDMILGEQSIVGSFNGSYSLPLAIPRLAEMVDRGELRLDPLITAERPLEELNQAMADLENDSVVRQVLKP